jgi:AcrR family transcriptional regulator
MPRLTEPRKRLLDALMRDTIYDAAVSVLVEHGVERMTMDRVALAAQMGKGSLYKYFESKEELLRFVHNKTVTPVLDDLQKIVGSDLPAAEKLDLHLGMLLKHSAEHAGVFAMLFCDDTTRLIVRPSEHTALTTAASHLQAIFEQGIREGVFRPLDTRQMAVMFIGLCTSLLEDALQRGKMASAEALKAILLSTFLQGIFKPAS